MGHYGGGLPPTRRPVCGDEILRTWRASLHVLIKLATIAVLAPLFI
jgi:hypothetical protein